MPRNNSKSMYKFRVGVCSICGKLIGQSFSSNKCSTCYWEKKQPQVIEKRRTQKQDRAEYLARKREYKREYWEGVRNGTIRRGVAYKHIITSMKGEPLRFGIVYEDSLFYEYAEFKLS